jgi:hypothetical protein
MKVLLLLLLGFLLLTPGYGESAPSTSTPHVVNLRQALCTFEWTWEPAKGGKSSVRFYRDGSLSNPKWFTGRWEVTGLRTVTLKSKKSGRKAFLTFNDDFTKYTGLDFSGVVRVEGSRVRAVNPEELSPESNSPQKP